MRQTRVQYPGATLGGQAGHYLTPAVKGMSQGVVRNIPSRHIPTSPIYIPLIFHY